MPRLRRTLVNFVESNGPRYTGAYAGAPPPPDEPFKIVSWNIKFGTNVQIAIVELQQVEVLRDAAVILLQEMDDLGVERIAQALDYNYVYYPASIHSQHGRNFGNAVLSRWSMVETVKIILPHASPSNQQRRIAVGALLDLGGPELAVYSVHTELPILRESKRREQLGRLGEQVAGVSPASVVVGGDFNTATAGSVALLDEAMATAGLMPVITDRGEPTMKLGSLRFTLDHLFCAGATAIASGVWSETAASDHFPIWAVFHRLP